MKTTEEIKEQFKRHTEQTEEEFAKDASRVQQSIKEIKYR